MIYSGTVRGQGKNAYVVKFLNSEGFTLNREEIDNVIEAVVLRLKLEQKKEA